MSIVFLTLTHRDLSCMRITALENSGLVHPFIPKQYKNIWNHQHHHPVHISKGFTLSFQFVFRCKTTDKTKFYNTSGLNKECTILKLHWLSAKTTLVHHKIQQIQTSLIHLIELCRTQSWVRTDNQYIHTGPLLVQHRTASSQLFS